MQQEIEAKFLRQDHEIIRKKLQALGAVCEYKTKLMRRTVYDFPDRRLQKEGAWVRLREEPNNDIELTLKKSSSQQSIHGVFESSITVHSYEAADQFLRAIGLEAKGEQESKRELWRLGDVEIMLDEWPWVPPFIEIEADSEQSVKHVAEQLDLKWENAVFGGVTPVYTDCYDISEEYFVSLELSMKFDDPVPDTLTKLQ
jgi:adenylate cyclase class 2